MNKRQSRCIPCGRSPMHAYIGGEQVSGKSNAGPTVRCKSYSKGTLSLANNNQIKKNTKNQARLLSLFFFFLFLGPCLTAPASVASNDHWQQCNKEQIRLHTARAPSSFRACIFDHGPVLRHLIGRFCRSTYLARGRPRRETARVG